MLIKFQNKQRNSKNISTKKTYAKELTRDKSTITKMKSILQVIDRRLVNRVQPINQLKDNIVKNYCFRGAK